MDKKLHDYQVQLLMNLAMENKVEEMRATLYHNAAMNTLKGKQEMFYMYQVINDERKIIFQSNDMVETKEFCHAYNTQSKRFCEVRENVIKMQWPAIKPELKKPEWIPALVRYQEVPFWWRLAEQKAKLMGEVILVKVVEPEETARFEAEYGSSKANFWSQRTSNGGKWYWNKADLILYPDALEVEMYSNVKSATTKKKKKSAIRSEDWMVD